MGRGDGDYPAGGGQGGRIRVLEDRDQDGRYDHSTIFLDNIAAPGSVFPWRRGVIVAAAPEVFYAEDQDGDGKADLRRTLLKGFVRSNPQHQVNGLTWGLDNWIHAANGDSSGVITVEATGHSLDIHSRDFRFHPDKGVIELESGMSQFTRCRDDWGNWFGGNSAWPIWHGVLPDRYLQRNPYWTPPETCEYLTSPASHPPVFPLSAAQPRLNEFGRSNRITSGCGGCIYRDDLFGADFRHSTFICEPAHNLVHHQRLLPDGATFRSEPLASRGESEFLASRDNWFRPTFCRTGPDGALWIVDMYRRVIEHPDFIEQSPDDWKDENDKLRLDDNSPLRAGQGLGRIYRVVPINRPSRPTIDLTNATNQRLADTIGSPNGPRRDMAQRLLVHRRARDAANRLRVLATGSKSPKTRIQALATLDGLDCLDEPLLLAVLGDKDAAVRRLAIRLAETRLASADVLAAVAERAEDENLRVVLQTAFSLGESKQELAGRALAAIALKHLDQPHVRAAVMSSIIDHEATILREAAKIGPATPGGGAFVADLLKSAYRNDRLDVVSAGLRELGSADNFSWRADIVAQLLSAIEQSATTLAALHANSDANARRSIESLDGLFATARRIAADRDAKLADRQSAVSLLGRGRGERPEDLGRLQSLLAPAIDLRLQQSAVETLSRINQPEVVDTLLADWGMRGPSIREKILDTLLSRRPWTESLLGAMERGRISVGEFSPTQRERLTLHYFPAIRKRAKTLFAQRSDDDPKLEQSVRAVAARQGDAVRGRQLFAKHCASCHREQAKQRGAGPSLAAMAEQSTPRLLRAILRPSDEVAPEYLSYTAVGNDGRVYAGVIASEAGASIQLIGADGKRVALLRSELRTLKSSGKSLMPDGLWRELKPQGAADLIEFLRAWRPGTDATPQADRP